MKRYPRPPVIQVFCGDEKVRRRIIAAAKADQRSVSNYCLVAILAALAKEKR